jgi:hypothetical protein
MVLSGTFFPPHFIEDVFTYPLFPAWTFFSAGVEDVFSDSHASEFPTFDPAIIKTSSPSAAR